MKTKILFPNHFKRIGWYLLIFSVILGILGLLKPAYFKFLDDTKVFAVYSEQLDVKVFEIIENNVLDEVLGILGIVGAIFVAFSKVKQEDEYIAKIRMESLVWAVYLNYAILIFCMIFFYNFGFFYVMIVNLFTILIFFIIRFYYLVYKSKKSLSHEE